MNEKELLIKIFRERELKEGYLMSVQAIQGMMVSMVTG